MNPPRMTTLYPPATIGTKRASSDSGTIRREPWTVALRHAATAVDVVAPSAGGSRWSVVSYSGSTIGGENATSSINFSAGRQDVGAYCVDLTHRHVATGVRKRCDYLSSQTQATAFLREHAYFELDFAEDDEW